MSNRGTQKSGFAPSLVFELALAGPRVLDMNTGLATQK